MTTSDETYEQRNQSPDAFDKPGFWMFIATQFQGAFSDNLYKLIILLYVPFLSLPQVRIPFLMQEPADFPVTAVGTALFNLPWLLFPAIAGALADRYSKKWVTVWTKVWEVGVMTSGVFGVMLGNPWLLFLTLFLMAMQSSFFSPAKYGLLPEVLPPSKLSWGNGMLNMWTFVAIILGNMVGGLLLDRFEERMYLAMIVVVAFSLVGLTTSLRVTPARPAEPTRRIPVNPYSGMGKYFRMFFADKRLFLTMVGIAYFWFAGALVLANVVELGKATLPGLEFKQSSLLAIMTLGIGVGSLAAGYLSRGKVEVGMVLPGLAGLGLTGALLAVPGTSYPYHMACLCALGFFAGLYDVPLAAMLQQRSPANVKGGMIATSNFVTFSAMMVSAALFLVLFTVLALKPQTIFLAVSCTAVLVGIYTAMKDPTFLLRPILWFLDGTLYKWRVSGRHHLPEKGGALLVGSHVSFVDALALMASTGREMRFVMGKDVLETRWMRPLVRIMNIIPVEPDATPEQLEGVVCEIQETIADGHVVCVNNEAQLCATGAVMPWFQDYHAMVGDTGAPVVPVYLSRLWEAVYAYKDNRIQWKWAGRLRYPIYVRYGEPVSDGQAATAVRDAVRGLGTDSYLERPLPHKLLHHAFIRAARRRPRNRAIADATTGELNYLKTLVGSIVFARKLKRILDDTEMVGVLVPPSVGGTLTNVALTILGKVPVNLNYTQPPEIIAACAARCGITQTLTSKKFLERMPIPVPGETVLLEDIRETVSGKDRLLGMLYAVLAPVWFMEWRLGRFGRSETDLSTVIFSSGSEGEPKGVMLTHRNILTQTETVAATFPHDHTTCLMGFLPFFHSFGITGTMWLVLTNGVRGVYHPNPLEPRIVGKLIEKYNASILIGTPTFLQGFIRRCTPEQLQSLAFVVTGAEKLSLRIRNAFQEKFGVEPMEGYGTTECAPVVAMNTADCPSPGFFWRGLRQGTIGRPLQGQSVRIADTDTGEVLGAGQPGLLQVRGPNTMVGYLDDPEKTAAVLKDGWYSTGDIAELDDEGFITITDRLARFSKIGGEMVPHLRIEETLHGILGLTEQALAVASVPSTRKGERLVVLHTLGDSQLEKLLAELGQSELPNLWRPRSSAFYRIDAIPVLGTGKMDIKAVKRMAEALDLGD